MSKISTKELIDEYFATDGLKIQKLRRAFKEEQIYNYEEQIGKKLVEMQADDIIGLLCNLRIRKGKGLQSITPNPASFNQFLSILRKIFDYYIYNYEVIRNPLLDPRLHGIELAKTILKSKPRLTWEYVADIIRKLHINLSEERADYIELIILLYYSGFESADEILEMQEKHINFRNKTVMLDNKVIHLSNRCYSLLKKFNEMEILEGWRNYEIVSWNNSYFKFFVLQSKAASINERSRNKMRENININISKYVNAVYGTQLNYNNLYYLGFYDFLVKKIGEEKLNQMLLPGKNKDDIQFIRDSAREYGCKVENITQIKKNLQIYTCNM